MPILGRTSTTRTQHDARTIKTQVAHPSKADSRCSTVMTLLSISSLARTVHRRVSTTRLALASILLPWSTTKYRPVPAASGSRLHRTSDELKAALGHRRPSTSLVWREVQVLSPPGPPSRGPMYMCMLAVAAQTWSMCGAGAIAQRLADRRWPTSFSWGLG
eukprot:scaffold1722_cov380-Prasinococcus_capsulatus_cf.AAC.4